MNLYTDECVYWVTVAALQSWGHDVVTTQEENLVGEADEVLLRQAVAQERVLVTNDLDFSNIRRYPPTEHRGIIVLKIRPRTLHEVHLVLKQLLENVAPEAIDQTLVIVDRNKYRVRRS